MCTESYVRFHLYKRCRQTSVNARTRGLVGPRLSAADAHQCGHVTVRSRVENYKPAPTAAPSSTINTDQHLIRPYLYIPSKMIDTSSIYKQIFTIDFIYIET